MGLCKGVVWQCHGIAWQCHNTAMAMPRECHGRTAVTNFSVVQPTFAIETNRWRRLWLTMKTRGVNGLTLLIAVTLRAHSPATRANHSRRLCITTSSPRCLHDSVSGKQTTIKGSAQLLHRCRQAVVHTHRHAVSRLLGFIAYAKHH